MDGKTLKPDLTIPEQKIASLSFCEASPRGVRDWVHSLPMANIGEVSRQLYHAIIEINQLFLPPQIRLQLLELVRPKIGFVCSELSRHYLGLAIALPEKQRKIANLSQALQLHLSGGYKTCVLEFLDNGGLDKNRKAIAMACHRSLSCLGATIVRAHQLYCPSPARSWLECHRLFRFAHRNRLLDVSVEDETLVHRSSSSVADAYKRILLLGCGRPNQLRQNELLQAYELFESWTELTHCSPELKSNALFVVNMERDTPPVYRSLVQQESGGDSFGFDTTELSERITRYLHSRSGHGQPADEPGIPLPASVSETLLTHLSQALGILTKRNFNRIASQGRLEVCVGLTATHFFVAGEKNFNQFVSGNESLGATDPEENQFLSASRRRNDVWAGTHDAGPSDDILRSADSPITFRGSGGSVDDSQQLKNRPRAYLTLLLNTSPGGYCVSWETEVPPALQAGEVLGVREQPTHPWSVAIVRWIRQVKNQGTQVGIELIAPSASPCGVRLIQKIGNSSEYLRGLLLPEISAVNQAATLVTPRLPFQPGSRISLLHDGREDQGQLSRRVSATGSISQFELKLQNRSLRELDATSATSSASEDEFDSLWPSL